MKPASSEFNSAWAASTIYATHKLVVEFGSNRFNDGQVVTASSTKTAHRGINNMQSDEAEFWRPSDVFNNHNRNTLKWLVCDSGAKLNKTADGTGYRAIKIDDGNYERGWWSGTKSHASTGVFASPEWVQSEFFDDDDDPFVRLCNKVVLYLTEGYANMSEVTVQYKNELGTWIDVEANRNLGASEYIVEWEFEEDIAVSGLRVYVHSTQEPDDYARISELQGYWIKDISDYVVSIDVTETREEYDQTVPVGTTAANTIDVTLDNTEGLFNTRDRDSVYTPYLGANNRVEAYYGVDVNQGEGSPEYEYVSMGEFWTDEWSNNGDGTSASFTGRDFSKFLQDDTFEWGRVWENTNIKPIFTDILLYMGMPIERINIDETNMRGYQIVFLKDSSPWNLFGELAFADQAMFGFDHNGDFYTHSYNVLNDPPYDSPVINLDWNTNIIDGSTRTELYVNKVKVNISPTANDETGVRPIWGPQGNTILSWAKLAADIDEDDTTITVQQAPRQTSGNLTDNLWVDKNGYLFLPTYEEREIQVIYNPDSPSYLENGGAQRTRRVRVVTGGELIKYTTRSDSQFLECERGYLNTPRGSWTAGQYIGEARVWETEWDNAPALRVSYPYATAIDLLEKIPWEGVPQADIIHFEYNAFNGVLAVGNTQDYYAILTGQGESLDGFDDPNFDGQITWNLGVAGEVSFARDGAEQVEEIAPPSAQNDDYIRRYGKNELEITNPWIQQRSHGEDIAAIMIDEYKVPRPIVELELLLNPAVKLAERVRITDYPQLSIENEDYHLINLRWSYDGGLKCSATLRGVKS
jgi:hypothetical protein